VPAAQTPTTATAAEAAEGVAWSGPPPAAQPQSDKTGAALHLAPAHADGSGASSSNQMPASSNTSAGPIASMTGPPGMSPEEPRVLAVDAPQVSAAAVSD